MEDRYKNPAVALPYLFGRPLAAAEVLAALGYRKSSYYQAARERRLRYGLIEPEAVSASAQCEPGLPKLRGLRPDPSKPPI